VSILLLRELAADPASTPEEYDRLTGYARMPNGVWRFTQHGRMRVVDAALMELLRARHAADTTLVVCDLAASTGATSVELYRAVRESFATEFVATDLYRDMIAVRSRHWPAAVVFDARGREVQYVCGPFVLPGGGSDSIVHPVNRALGTLLDSWLVPRARRALDAAGASRLAPFEAVVHGSFEVVRLPMLTRDALGALDAPDFRFEAWDVLDPLPLRAHVVRAMNIFTRDHLAEDERRRGLRHCVQALHPDGLFVVGWSPHERPMAVEASIYGVRDGRLTRLRSFNGGSEIDVLLESMFAVTDGTRECPPSAYVRGSDSAA